MSTLAATYLKDRATIAQLPVTSVLSGVAKAWGVLPFTSMTLAQSLNIASVTDSGVGFATLNYTAVFSLSMNGTAAAPINHGYIVSCHAVAALAYVRVYATTSTLTDDWAGFAVMGALA